MQLFIQAELEQVQDELMISGVRIKHCNRSRCKRDRKFLDKSISKKHRLEIEFK